MDRTPETNNLLDIRGWARATLIQISRIRDAWLNAYGSGTVRAALDPDDGDQVEAMSVDVHFLLIAAHQLIAARKRRVSVPLPTIDDKLVQAIEQLRPIREHYAGHRAAFYGTGELTAHGRKLRRIDPDADPWLVSGSIAPEPGRELNVAGVLPLEQLETEVTAIRDAAHAELVAVLDQQQEA